MLILVTSLPIHNLHNSFTITFTAINCKTFTFRIADIPASKFPDSSDGRRKWAEW